MHRFFVAPESTQADEIDLPDSEAHHALRVLRLRPEDRVVLLNGAGEEILAQVIEASRQSVRVRVVQRHRAAPPACRLTLLQAVPKAKAMDFIVQKATEIGAARVVPLLTERSLAHWDDATAAHKVVKWRMITVEAAKQCGTPWLPQIEPPLPLPAYLARAERHDLTLLASLQPDAHHPRRFFDEFRREHGRAPTSLAMWVGPEGDFTPAEINTIRASAARPISLGPLVLRSETAAVYCLAVASYETQLRDPA